MEWLKFIIVAGLVVFVLDRVGLWLESKGWLYWRKVKPSQGSGLGNALQGFEALLRPSAKYVIELKQQDSKQRDDQGDGASDALKFARAVERQVRGINWEEPSV